MPVDISQHQASPWEQARAADLITVMPKHRTSVLEIGARSGFITEILTGHYRHVTALDLETPAFVMDRVVPVKGDVRSLRFPDNHFDSVVCTEVLEHINPADLQQACSEIVRVARRDVVIGVPYRQDRRLGRTTCCSCGRANPPWGHFNSFDESRLARLFQPLSIAFQTYVGAAKTRTNRVSSLLHDLAGNPYGSYNQDESCVHCGTALERPWDTSLLKRALSGAALRLTSLQQAFHAPRPIWIHTVFTKAK